MKRISSVILLVLMLAVQVAADGKMYWREKIPPSIPYQRALILFKEGTETLILQSKYEVPKADSKTSIGWVVPVPSEPQLASMPADSASLIFLELNWISHPDVTHFGSGVIATFLIALLIISILILFACALSLKYPFPDCFLRIRKKLKGISIRCCAYICVATALYLLFPALGVATGVEVVHEQRVGIFDVKVVKADDSSDLIAWLNKNKFSFDDDDKKVFDSYIKQRWHFVVANINPGNDQKGNEITLEGLAAPLILRFAVKQPVYPLALTGTGKFNTKILIYLLSDVKMTCDNHLALRYAGERKYNGNILEKIALGVEPENFFKTEEAEEKNGAFPYLCKFRDTLTPAEMSQDIVFRPAKDNTPYREHIVKW